MGPAVAGAASNALTTTTKAISITRTAAADSTATEAAATITMSSQQQQQQSSQPQRITSFRGLPPIQRSTSFGLPKFDTLTEKNELNVVTQQCSASPTVLQPTAEEVESFGSPTSAGSTEQTNRSSLVQEDNRLGGNNNVYHYQQQPPQQPQQQQQCQQPSLQGQQSLQPQQLQQLQTTIPRHIALPSGWQLEESHLAEPLHQARRRPGTGNTNSSVSPPSGYDYDKETGFPISTSPVAPPPQPIAWPTPNGNSATPGRHLEPLRSAPSGHQQPLGARAHTQLPVATDHQEDIHERKKVSGIFRGLGNRIRASSSERRPEPPPVTAAGVPAHAKKQSIFLAASTKAASVQHRFIPGGAPPSPWAEQGRQRPGSAGEFRHAKRRLSGFTDKATGWAGKFGSGGGGPQKSGTPRSSSGSGQVSPEPSSVFHHARGKSSSSLDMVPPPAMTNDGGGPESSELRGRGRRRSSLAGIITNFTREKSSSRARQDDQGEQQSAVDISPPPVVLDPPVQPQAQTLRPSPLGQQQYTPAGHESPSPQPMGPAGPVASEHNRSAVGVASLMPNPCFTRAASVSPSPTFEAARPEQQLHQDQKQQMQQQQGPQAGAGGEADSLLSSPSPALSRMTQDTSSPPPPLNFNGSSSPSKIGSSVSSSPNQSQICASQVNPPSVLPLAPYQRQQVQQQAYPPNGNVAPPLQPAGASSRLEWQSDQNAWLQPNQQPMNSPRLQGQSQGQPMVQPQVYQPYNPAYAVSQTRPSPQHPQPAQYVQLYYYQAPGTGQGPPSTPGTAAQGHLTPETSSRLKGWRNRLSSQWAPNVKADKDKPAEPQPALSNHSKNRLSSDKFLSALKRPSKQADESAGSAATPAPQQPAQQHQPAHHHPHWMMPGHRPQQASLPQAHQMPPPQHGMASGQYHQPQPQPQPQPQQQLYGALGGHVPVQGSYLPQWQATPAPVWSAQQVQPQMHHPQPLYRPSQWQMQQQVQQQAYYQQQMQQQPVPYQQGQSQQAQQQPNQQPAQHGEQQHRVLPKRVPVPQVHNAAPTTSLPEETRETVPNFSQQQQRQQQVEKSNGAVSSAPAPEGSNSMVSSSLQKEQQDEMSRATTAKDTQSPSMSSPSISSRQGETSNPGLVSPKTDDGDNVSPTKKDNGDPDDTNVPEKGKDKARVLSVDVTAKTPDHDDLYDATPRLPQGAADTGKARNDAAMSSSDSDSDGDDDMARSATAAGILTASSVASQMEQKPKPEYSKPESSTGQYELEDTAGARMRTMRLSSQEEKIYYDPDADKPKMSATSYPGQEWNPYSDAEFTYWDD